MPELHWLGDGEAKREALKALLPFYAGRVKCIFLMTTHIGKAGRSVAEQIRKAITSK